MTRCMIPLAVVAIFLCIETIRNKADMKTSLRYLVMKLYVWTQTQEELALESVEVVREN